MSVNIPYIPNAYVPRYNAVPSQVSASVAAAAEGGFVGDVMGGSLPMIALNYGKTIYQAARHPKNCMAAIKQTENIMKTLEGAEKLKGLSDVQRAAVYGETYRKVNKAINLGKSPAVVTRFGNKVATQAAGRTLAAGAETAANIANATTTAGKAWAWTKGALKSGGFKGMAIFSALFELPELYSAYSQGGVGEGLAQTVKSGVKVAGDAAGWALGAAGGAKAGAAIGTMICPGLGTGIGAAIGTIIGGLGGSWIGRKTAKAVTGKSFNEKLAEQQEQQQMQPSYDYQPGYNPFMQPSYGIQLDPYLPRYNPYLFGE